MALRTPIRLLLSGLAVVGLSGCDLNDLPVLKPAGPVALAERDLLFWAFAMMLVVVIPAFVMTAWFATRYRSSNTKARYRPDWDEAPVIEAIIWLVPAAIVVALATLLWRSTHDLDPYRPLAANKPPLHVQAIALDWKWVFIYPDLQIATVNQLAAPVGRPISMDITADTVMNALYIPRLAGQIFAMAGMRTKLNFVADQPGDFIGRNSQYSGREFSRQHFQVRALSGDDFAKWQTAVRGSHTRLDAAAYDKLQEDKATSPVLHFGAIERGLFERTIGKYAHKSSHSNSRAAAASIGSQPERN